tara:strand:+ start:215 stop:805 length:591 start_codon:yes stop_codon:yes gene_type:complete
MSTDGFTKYVPPHMRNKKNRRGRNKNLKKENKIDIADTNHFPEFINPVLVQKNNQNSANNNWINEAKKKNFKPVKYNNDTYFNINNLKFKMDETIPRGWILLNKNKDSNRGNCTDEEIILNEEIERYAQIEANIRHYKTLSKNSEGIYLVPFHNTCFDYDTDEENENSDEIYDEKENDNEEEEDNNYNDESDNEYY